MKTARNNKLYNKRRQTKPKAIKYSNRIRVEM